MLCMDSVKMSVSIGLVNAMAGDIIDILMNVDEDDEEYYGNEEDSDTDDEY